MKKKRKKNHPEIPFLLGVGFGHLVTKGGGNLILGVIAHMEERRIKADLERRRIVDVMGDTVGYYMPGVGP